MSRFSAGGGRHPPACRTASAPRIVRVAETMFGHPLVAHGAQIFGTAASLPHTQESDDREDRAGATDQPDGVHRRSHDCLQRVGAVLMRLRFHISPHATQRQYVEASTFWLAALMVPAPQKGQDVGATAGGGISGRRFFTTTSGCFDTGPKLGRSARHPAGHYANAGRLSSG